MVPKKFWNLQFLHKLHNHIFSFRRSGEYLTFRKYITSFISHFSYNKAIRKKALAVAFVSCCPSVEPLNSFPVLSCFFCTDERISQKFDVFCYKKFLIKKSIKIITENQNLSKIIILIYTSRGPPYLKKNNHLLAIRNRGVDSRHTWEDKAACFFTWLTESNKSQNKWQRESQPVSRNL
jgi:hypothetical protein